MKPLLVVVSCLLLSSVLVFAQSPASPAVTSSTSPDVQAFQKIEDNWSMSINQRDQYGMELVLSALFVNIGSSGDVSTRDQLIAALIKSEDKTAHLEQKVITVRTLGDVAVVTGTYTYHHKVGAQPIDEKGIFTHIYQKLRGGWYCVNAQQTLLREDGLNTAKPKKQSNAEMPFHIPIFSK